MNASSKPSAGALHKTGNAAQPSIGDSAAFWAAMRALPVDWENEAYSELCGDVISVIDAHMSTLQATVSAQSQEISGLRARQVKLLCASVSKEDDAVADPAPQSKLSIAQVDPADLDSLIACEGLASGLIHNAGSPANTVAARKLHAMLTRMRDVAAQAQRVESEDTISQLAMSFAKRHQSFDSFQNHSHRYLVKRLSAGEANDTIGSSLRLVRAAAIVAREFTVSGASMHEVVTALNDVKPMPSKADAIGEALIALAGVASAGRVHLDSVGDDRLAVLGSSRAIPSFYSDKDLLPLPF